MKRLLLIFVMAFVFVSIGVAQEEEAPVLVYISWDGSPGWVVERLVNEGKLPNLKRLIDSGVWVKESVGNWPSLTAAGHAAVFTGAYGNVNGVTGNAVPQAPFEETVIGTRGASGFSAANLLVEPIWITAARAGRRSALVSVTQSSPFEMYASDDYVSSQGAQAFGDFSDELLLLDGYASRRGVPTPLTGSTEGGEFSLAISDSDGAEWTNLPEGAAFKAFTLGGSAEPTEDQAVWQGLIVAEDGTTFDQIVLSQYGDYANAVTLSVTPFTNDASQMSAPVQLTSCQEDECVTGWTHLRLTELAEDGSSFTLWHTFLSDLSGVISDESRIEPYLENGGAFTGNGANPPVPFTEIEPLPNIYGEIAFTVNEWFFNNLVYEIEQNEHDLYFSYSPYPDEWHHYFYNYMDENSPVYTEEGAAKAWSYAEAMYGNLDTHLGNVIDALDATGRDWNIVMFTDHGFQSAWNIFYPNRVLANAGLLVVDAEGNIDLTQTKAYFGYEGTGGVHINTVDGQAEGIVTAEEYDDVVQQVTDALMAATDPETGEVIVTAVDRSDEMTEEGIGGLHGADLYLELAYGYYWRADAVGAEPIVGENTGSPGIHGPRPLGVETMTGFGVLGGDQFADGVVVDEARSIDFTPTAALAVGIDPAPHWVGTAHEDWIAQ